MVGTSEELLRIYFDEAESIIESLLDDLNRLKEEPEEVDLVHDIVRKFHTLKGNSYSVGYKQIGNIFHKLEDYFVAVRDKKAEISENLILQTISVLMKIKDSLEYLSSENATSDDSINISFDISETPQIPQKIHRKETEETKIKKEETGVKISQEEIENFRNELKSTNPDVSKFIDHIDPHELSKVKELAEKGKTIFLSFVKFSLDEDFDEKSNELMKEMKKNGFEVISIIPQVEGENIVLNFIIVPTKENYNPEVLKKIANTYVIWKGKTEKSAPQIIRKKGTLRVAVEDVERIMQLIGDMITAKNSLQSSISRIIGVSAEADQRIRDSLNEITRRIKELQDIILEVRMIPISEILKGIINDIRTTAYQTGKLVKIEQELKNVVIDIEIAKKIRNSLLHIARNAVAHGIETPEEREKKGKPPEGKIVISAERKGGDTIISITDDGRGIDPEKIVKKYLEWVKDFPEIAEKFGGKEEDFKEPDGRWKKEKVFEILFLPGFSTRDKADQSAGRGAGLDEVKKEIESLKGKIEVDSEPGYGTTFKIRIPTTKIVVEVVIFMWKDKKYAIPLSYVMRSEIFQLNSGMSLKKIQGRNVLTIGGKEIPVVSVNEILGEGKTEIDGDRFFVLILEGEGRNTEVGLIVDEILSIKDSVMKNIDENILKIRGISAVIEEIGSDGKKELIPVIDVLKIPQLI